MTKRLTSCPIRIEALLCFTLLCLFLACGAWAQKDNEENDMAKVELKEGMKAPEFQASSSEGGEIALKDLAGKIVVLYFYPKDSTPGCTKEACGFRDANAGLKELGVIVLGVSKDSLKSHGKFIEKHGLNFPLLSDPEGKILDAYGAWKEKTLYGRTALGIERSTFLIDGDGVIRKIWRKVKVGGHVDEVVEAVKGLSNPRKK